jgi:hypothetical protein
VKRVKVSAQRCLSGAESVAQWRPTVLLAMKSRSKVFAINGSRASMRPWNPIVLASFMIWSRPAWKASITGTGELAAGATAAGGLTGASARATPARPPNIPSISPRAIARAVPRERASVGATVPQRAGAG